MRCRAFDRLGRIVGYRFPFPCDSARDGCQRHFRAQLVTDETLTADEADAIADAARTEMDEAVEFGLASPFPAPERATDYVYA